MRRATWIAAAAALVAIAVPSAATASDDDVRRSGECTGASSVKIKAKPDDGQLEVELEVDQNRNGQPWKVKIKDDGDVVVRDSARTHGPSGSFSIERRIPDRAGTDTIVGSARNKRSGERCVARVNI